jgi:ABC-type Fe3+ transport system permease subunit
MTTIQFVAYPTQWIPDPLKLSNIVESLQLLGWRPFFNSTLLAICAILGQTIFGMMAAFAIALLRKDSVSQKLPVVGELLSDDGSPAIVIAVVQGTLTCMEHPDSWRNLVESSDATF